MIHDFHACDFLDQDYQFNTIKPISAQIVAKISVIGDTPDINVQMFGDKSAHFINIDTAPICSPYSLTLANTANCHDEPPIRHKLWHGCRRRPRTNFAMFYCNASAILSPPT